jgi:hypothetical protein
MCVEDRSVDVVDNLILTELDMESDNEPVWMREELASWCV